MSHDDELSHQRRQLLQWVAASPLIALPLGQEAFAEDPKELLRNFRAGVLFPLPVLNMM